MSNFFSKLALSITMVVLMTNSAMALEKVTKEVTINAPINKVWDKIGSFCAIADWHPAVAKCVEKRKGEELRRTLTLEGGGDILELLTGENETSYTYIVEDGVLPVKNYTSTISVARSGDDKTKVTWTGSMNGKGKTDKEAAEFMGGVYQAGLDNLAKFVK